MLYYSARKAVIKNSSKLSAIKVLTQLAIMSALLLGLLGLNGCAKQTTPGKVKLHTPSKSELENWKVVKQKLLDIKSFNVAGKASFSNGQKGASGNIDWQQQKDNYTIVVQGPLNIGSVRIVGQPNLVSLMKADGSMAVHKSAEALLKERMGIAVPLAGMSYWIRGIEAPGDPPTKIMFDPAHHLGLLEQHGWTIEYEDYVKTAGHDLPQRITFKNGNLLVKLILKEWRL